MNSDWQPGASLSVLRQRAAAYQQIRQFFNDRGLLEVETPQLCQAPVTDPNIVPIQAGQRFLHTSPEYAMKRLLCAGSGDIYQICKVFREGEAGSRHNPEFNMLEWYRVGWDHHRLMEEVSDLLHHLLGERIKQQLKLTYREALIRYADFDLNSASDDIIRNKAIDIAGADLQLNNDGWLDIIISHLVEPNLPRDTLVFISDYPQSQAALAKIRHDQNGSVAERFEVFFNGVELANGYHELTDANEQRIRFNKEAAERQIDERLLSAIAEGMPDCAGVAVGIDRLMMTLSNKNTIDEVVSFSWGRA